MNTPSLSLLALLSSGISSAKAEEPLLAPRKNIYANALTILGESTEKIPELCPQVKPAHLVDLGSPEEEAAPIRFFTESDKGPLITVQTVDQPNTLTVSWSGQNVRGFSVGSTGSAAANCVRSSIASMNKTLPPQSCRIEVEEQDFNLPNGNPLRGVTEKVQGYFMSLSLVCQKN